MAHNDPQQRRKLLNRSTDAALVPAWRSAGSGWRLVCVNAIFAEASRTLHIVRSDLLSLPTGRRDEPPVFPRRARFRHLAPICFSLAPQARRGLLFLIPPFFMGSRRARLALGWREAPGGVCVIHTNSPPPCTSFAPLTICFPSPQSGRDEDRRWRGTVRNDMSAYLQCTSAFSPRWPREFCIV
jgi:hypothetical protein